MDRQHLLNQYATDMAGVTQHIQNAVEHQRASGATDAYPELNGLLDQIISTLKGQNTALEAYNEGTEGGGVLEAAKEAFLGVLGEAAGLIDRLRNTDQVSRMVRDDYTALSLAAVSYHMLHTTALGLKDQKLADLALTHLGQITPLLVKLSKTVCTVVAHELNSEDRIIDGSVADQAIENTQKMWSPDHTNQ
ncbi:hypothetical protein [Rubricoccus marinus]|uniref:Uncharacterized protein n=1 Tax=Rubricoccus marinus TaxID=716817 RepID=A0A259U016_9BACT|nr:hypothetical protein [Rubricoccus marinus]OZC03178.1 hypothetical protein BSZ36_09450 [Rubricoccus marinus]